MSYGTTSRLTPELATAIVEEWADSGKSFNEIVKELRAEGYKVSGSDISNWLRQNRSVEIGGEKHGFRDLCEAVWIPKVRDMALEMITVADSAVERGESVGVTRNRINARRYFIQTITPQHLRLTADSLPTGIVVPENAALFRGDPE